MYKKKTPKYGDSFAEMYKPPFVPHERLLCTDLNKSYMSDINEKKKLIKPKSK